MRHFSSCEDCLLGVLSDAHGLYGQDFTCNNINSRCSLGKMYVQWDAMDGGNNGKAQDDNVGGREEDVRRT